MNCRDLGRALQMGSPEAVEQVFKPLKRQNRNGGPLQNFAFEVITAGSQPQLDRAFVGLESREVGQKAGCGPQGNGKDPADGRVEGAPMTDLLEPIGPAYLINTGMGGGSAGLVEDQKSAGESSQLRRQRC
jgi:hypothetical protein